MSAEAAKLAAEAAMATTEAIEEIKEEAQAAVEQAAAEVSAAQETAAQIAKASVETEHGRRIEGIERWRDEHETTIHHALTTELSGLRAAVTELTARLPPMIVSAPAEPQIAEPSGPTQPPPEPVTEMILAESPESASEGDQKVVAPKRKRHLL